MDKEKKRGLAALIIEAMPKSSSHDEDDGETESDLEDSDEKEIAAKEIIMAIDDHDKKALNEALSSYIKLCLMDYEEEDQKTKEIDTSEGRSKFPG